MRLMMMAGGIVEPGAGQPGAVSAYVVLSAGRGSRIFKVHGWADSPSVTELPAAITVDLGRFQTELAADLAPALTAIRSKGGAAAISTPSREWVCGVVKAYIDEHDRGDG
jgi:hypothetical protein